MAFPTGTGLTATSQRGGLEGPRPHRPDCLRRVLSWIDPLRQSTRTNPSPNSSASLPTCVAPGGWWGDLPSVMRARLRRSQAHPGMVSGWLYLTPGPALCPSAQPARVTKPALAPDGLTGSPHTQGPCGPLSQTSPGAPGDAHGLYCSEELRVPF